MSVRVVTLSLSSSYNLASSIASGGYAASDTVTIPFAVSGSGTKIVTMYLDYAERQARRGNIMYMRDWVARLDAFLQFNEEEVLHHKGKVTAAIAKAFAESEFEKYRVIQDRQYQSDFDRLVASTEDKD